MWTGTESDMFTHTLWRSVDFLLKVLGTTGRRRLGVIPRAGHKPGGYPVDNRWTTVDNRPRGDDCGHRPRFVPRLPTGRPPVDNALTSADSSSPQSAQDL
jgi:hypothetical protein